MYVVSTYREASLWQLHLGPQGEKGGGDWRPHSTLGSSWEACTRARRKKVMLLLLGYTSPILM